MKTRFTLLSLIAVPLVLSGCGVYGSGTTTGYIYAVDDGPVWSKVWFKTSLEASESDCYVVDSGKVKDDLKPLIGGTKVNLTYRKHLATFFAFCGESGEGDEITGFTEYKAPATNSN